MRFSPVLSLVLALPALAAVSLPAAAQKKPAEKPAMEETLAVTDTADVEELPPYQMGARIAMGENKIHIVNEEDTFLDIARNYGLGYVELRAANPDIDPWKPLPGSEIVIPQFQLLPRARHQGIVVNLGKMRLYHFRDAGKPPVSYPLGIGREGLQTPLGTTTIVRRAANPSWYPTERMRQEKPWLPRAVAPGAANPLGTHALYLGWPTFLIHGSNKPWGIGRRVSSGCLRLYPEDIVELFGAVPDGTRVTVVDQPVLVGWLDDGLYLEANPTQLQSVQIENNETVTPRPLNDTLRKMIIHAAGVGADRIDWKTVEDALKRRSGMPVMIAPNSARRAPLKKNAAAKDLPKPVQEKKQKRAPRNTQDIRYN